MNQFPTTMHHFWATWYIVPGAICFIVSAMCLFLFTGLSFSQSSESEIQAYSRLALASAAALLLSFVWPVLLLVGIVYVFAQLVRNLK